MPIRWMSWGALLFTCVAGVIVHEKYLPPSTTMSFKNFQAHHLIPNQLLLFLFGLTKNNFPTPKITCLDWATVALLCSPALAGQGSVGS